MVKIGPTGKCFDNALDEFQRLIKEKRERRWNNEFKLAHGILVSETGEHYSHAWLETKDSCWDFGIVLEGEHKGCECKFEVEKPLYYREKRVIDSTIYSWDEATRWNMLLNNFGPWLPKYRELCKNLRSARH